jgi:predicted dienelactone hydrolase
MPSEARTLQVHDAARGLAFPAQLWVPRAGEGWPLVALSHGGGGSHQLYSTVARHLAARGFVVVLPEHPGNNRRDNRLQGTLQNLEDRPRHLVLAMDAVRADAELGPRVAHERAAVVGHSMGGYTALAVAGGRAFSERGEPVAARPDPRVRALVLLAPATAWYLAPEALRRLDLPILLLEAEHDPITPAWQGDLVQNGVADRSKVTRRTVPGAGHFSFLTPFPPAMIRPDFAPGNDPPGFDRAAFHRVLPLEVSAFLEACL